MHLRLFILILLTYFSFSSLILFGNENSEEEFYILPDFVVTDDDDKGYYSANTLAGTRTNELTKNIPMTISTVNAEMIEDFKMKTLEDLGNFVPSIEAEGNVYNNQEIRFRGLLTKNQLYEFMPRYSPLDWYNVGRSDIIRGANSLIYGQADPGGKVNVISKTANLNKDKGSVVFEIGDKSWHKFSYDINKVLDNKTAARVMFVDKHREFDANYKYQSFTGATLELLHQLTPNTRLRLHLEKGVSERSLIGGTFKVGNTPTGLPNGIVADPKLADLISDEFLQEIANYSKLNEFSDNGTPDNPYDDFNSIYSMPFDGLSSIYGYIDVNKDGRVENNFLDWNGNNKYDYDDVYLLDAQTDISNGNPLAILRDRYGNSILDSEGNEQPLLGSPIYTLASNNNSATPIYSNGYYYNIPPPSRSTIPWSVWTGLNPDAVRAETLEKYADLPEINVEIPQLRSNGNGQVDPGENSYITIGRNGNGIWNTQLLGDNPATQEIENDYELYPADLFIDKETGEPITLWTEADYNKDGIISEEEQRNFHLEYADANENGFIDDDEYLDLPTGDLKSGVINRGSEPIVNSKGENADLNADGIYNDSDYAMDLNSGGGRMNRSDNPNIWGFGEAGGSLVPDWIDTRNDIRNLFRGIDFSNSGTGFGPHSHQKRTFNYALADIDHIFSDELSVKVAFAFEDIEANSLQAGWSSNQLLYSSGYGETVLFPTLRSINAYYKDPRNKDIKTPYEAVLVDLTNANYAHRIIETVDNQGIETLRGELKSAIIGDVLGDDPSTEGITETDFLLKDYNNNGIPETDPRFKANVDFRPFRNTSPNPDDPERWTMEEVIDYFVDSFIKPYTDDGHDLNSLEQYYEIAKLGGRIKNFLDYSHKNYENSYSYLWGNNSNGGESLGGIFYDILTDGQQTIPNGKATSEIYDLDRYVDVTKYREQLLNYSNPNDFLLRTERNISRTVKIYDQNGVELGSNPVYPTTYNKSDEDDAHDNTWSYETVSLQNPNAYAGFVDAGENTWNSAVNPATGETVYFQIETKEFGLFEDGEKLIYDSIPNWLIEGLNGQPRDMNALGNVEITGAVGEGDYFERFDNKVDGTDPDEVDLQKRAMAKKIYKLLITDNQVRGDDPSTENVVETDFILQDVDDNTFWDSTKKVYDFFKYEFHESLDYGWMWRDTIQKNLLIKLGAILEDTEYLDDASEFVDLDGDGEMDLNPSPSLSNSTGEILEPYIKRQWKKSTQRDTNKSARITFSYNENKRFIPGKQQMLFGIDLDKRSAVKTDLQQVSLNARSWRTPLGSYIYLRNEILSDHSTISDIVNGTEGDYAEINDSISGHQYSGAPAWITKNRIPLYSENLVKWEKTYEASSDVSSTGLWFASSGSYINGKLRTLLGVRSDSIKTVSDYSRFTVANIDQDNENQNFGAKLEQKSQVYDETIVCPSIGGLYWFTKNLAIFGNYSESVMSPNGFQFDVFGDITPPETGKGTEIGFKMSTPDNVLNGQLTVFSIEKKNEQRQNISYSMLQSLYPAENSDGSRRTEPYANGHHPDEIYDYYVYKDRNGNNQRDPVTGKATVRSDFNPLGYRVADEEVKSEGLELDLYFNPNRNISVFLGYAYLETFVLKSQLSILEGLPTAGTSNHSANFTFKYSFKQGKFKGVELGFNQKYRSKALLNHYFSDLNGDGQADYFPREVADPLTNGTTKITVQPRWNTLWLEDQFNTDIFLKWAGKIKKHHPWTVLQLNINNIFNNRDLISTGLNNARYTEGRNIVLSAGLHF